MNIHSQQLNMYNFLTPSCLLNKIRKNKLSIKVPIRTVVYNWAPRKVGSWEKIYDTIVRNYQIEIISYLLRFHVLQD
jgi:hypothetical protein